MPGPVENEHKLSVKKKTNRQANKNENRTKGEPAIVLVANQKSNVCK